MKRRRGATRKARLVSAVQTPPPRYEIVYAMQPATAEIFFREALHDLALAPTPENVRRYLAASRLLDGGTRKPTRTRKRKGGSGGGS